MYNTLAIHQERCQHSLLIQDAKICQARRLGNEHKMFGAVRDKLRLATGMSAGLSIAVAGKRSTQGQMVNILSLADHRVSITAAQFCQCCTKGATDNVYMTEPVGRGRGANRSLSRLESLVTICSLSAISI